MSEPGRPGPAPHTRDKAWLNARVVVVGGCWVWQQSTTPKGYGVLGFSDGEAHRYKRAHRLAWEIYKGPIPDGAGVLHRCDNPPCCNPDHLFLGTNADNTRDMMGKGREAGGSMPGESNPSSRLTESDVRAIRVARGSGVRASVLALVYRVSTTTIYNIVNRKKWKHVE